jgi:hypothetical protein
MKIMQDEINDLKGIGNVVIAEPHTQEEMVAVCENSNLLSDVNA